MSRFACLVALILCGTVAHAGVMLTAEVYETPGMPGYQTYDLSVWSPLGYIGGVDFLEGDSGGGIVGSLAQATSPGGGGGYDPLYTDGSLTDSHWLFSQNDGLQIRASQSAGGLYGAFTFFGSDAEGASRSRSIARLVTNDPASVTIGGDFDVREYWDDGTRVGAVKHRVDVRLSELELRSPRNDSTLPPVPANVLAERQREEERKAAAEEYRRRMAESRQNPVPPVAEPANPGPPAEASDTTPQEPTSTPPPSATLDDYQQGLDQKASAIRAQIEVLNSSLSQVNKLRTASEQPGFQLPATSVSAPGRGTPIFGINYPDRQIAIDAIQIEPINFQLFDLTGFVATTTAYDADLFRTRSLLTLDAVSSNALAASTATPEPGCLAMIALTVASLSARSRRGTRR